MKYAQVIGDVVVSICGRQTASCTVPIADVIELGMSPTATAAEVATAQISTVRSRTIAAIEARTADLLQRGAEYPAGSGHTHSLSGDRVAIYEAAKNNRTSLPAIKVVTRNKQVIVITGEAQIIAMYSAMQGRYLAVTQVGADLISEANAATTIAQLEAIVDDRQ